LSPRHVASLERGWRKRPQDSSIKAARTPRKRRERERRKQRPGLQREGGSFQPHYLKSLFGGGNSRLCQLHRAEPSQWGIGVWPLPRYTANKQQVRRLGLLKVQHMSYISAEQDRVKWGQEDEDKNWINTDGEKRTLVCGCAVEGQQQS
jgi:hypothetical protein